MHSFFLQILIGIEPSVRGHEVRRAEMSRMKNFASIWPMVSL